MLSTTPPTQAITHTVLYSPDDALYYAGYYRHDTGYYLDDGLWRPCQ